jgi:DNA polymerase-3 subunit gamma/tau
MRDAQSLLEQVLACAASGDQHDAGPVIDEELLQSILGLAERELLYQMSEGVLQGDPKRCLELIARTVAHGRDLTRLSRDLVEHFRNLLVARLTIEDRQQRSGDTGTGSARPRIPERAFQDRGGRTEDRGLQPSAAGLLLELPDQEISDLRAQAEDLAVENLLEYLDLMAAGDEEVACSANPRFALEALLVRLALLPKTVPIAELIDRLERLEGKIAPALRPSASGVERSGGTIQPAPPVPSHEVSGSGADQQRVWQDFVAFVGKEKKFLASHLAAGTALEVSAGTLKIGIAERHHLTYLQDADNLAALRTLASRFFSAEVAISLASITPELPPAANEARERARPSRSEPISDMANEALRIFGGSVRMVRREN